MNQNLLNLGQVLKEKREEQGLSLQKISEWTKINVRVLEAIESAQVKELPVYVYLRGFILSYAKALGMDEKEIEKELKSLAPQTEPASSPWGTGPFASSEKLLEKDLRLTPVILAISILFVLGGILVFANIIRSYNKLKPSADFSEEGLPSDGESVSKTTPSSKSTKPRQLREQSKTGIETTEKNQVSAKDPDEAEEDLNKKSPREDLVQPTVKKSAEVEVAELEIIVKALENVQFSYQEDQEKEKELSLKANQFKVLKARKKIFLKTDTSDLIHIFQDGINLGVFGSGGKKEKTFLLNKKSSKQESAL